MATHNKPFDELTDEELTAIILECKDKLNADQEQLN
jgi:hypothetical protein